ncbi:MAG: hypothetical protein A2046_02025 [Bacteroidetes bacterium GWA2_30_7]|nr:MAG: hypothetical protein A2046_02025 [Bacteroidetes bacterium GWA2_30_7]
MNEITAEKVQEYDSAIDELNYCIKNTELRLKVKLKIGGRYSNYYRNSWQDTDVIWESFNNKNKSDNLTYDFIEFYNSSKILDIVEFLELGG